MKVFFEKLMDIVYDYIDWFVMGAIIVAIIFTIGWRLDVLFEKNTGDMVSNGSLAQGNKEEPEKPTKPSGEDPSGQGNSQEDPDEAGKENPEEPGKPNENIETIVVEIPAGSPSDRIGGILHDKGLVDSTKDFVDKAAELGLDRRLQSGTFKIPKDSSLDTIVKIVAKQI